MTQNRMTNTRSNPNPANSGDKRQREADTETAPRKKQKTSQTFSVSMMLQSFEETKGHVSLIELTWKDLHDLSQHENIKTELKGVIESCLKNHLTKGLISKIQFEFHPYFHAFRRLSSEEAKAAVIACDLKFDQKIAIDNFDDYSSVTECFKMLLEMITPTASELTRRTSVTANINSAKRDSFFSRRGLSLHDFIKQEVTTFKWLSEAAPEKETETLKKKVKDLTDEYCKKLDEFPRKLEPIDDNKCKKIKEEADVIFAKVLLLHNEQHAVLRKTLLPPVKKTHYVSPAPRIGLPSSSSSSSSEPVKTSGFKKSSMFTRGNQQQPTQTASQAVVNGNNSITPTQKIG